MWTLFGVVMGMANPIVINGFETQDECEVAGEAAVQALTDPINGVIVQDWCMEPPMGWRLRGESKIR